MEITDIKKTLRAVAAELTPRLLKIATELIAKMTNKRFYCNALSGFSDYNISINCDMTVSCNCQNYDDSGYIGDLLSQNLSEIFNGHIANEFRSKLANGRLPISICARCRELRLVERERALYFRQNHCLPRRGIIIENTADCNLKCVSCHPGRLSLVRKKTSLTLAEIKRISLLLKEYQIESISFFKTGEPFFSTQIYDGLKIIRDDNPYIKIWISTNGTLLNTEEKRNAALMADHIVFSIDGMNDSVLQKYQRNGSFDEAFNNMKDLVIYRDSRGFKKPVIEWKYVLFNWNDKKDMILKAIELAKSAKVDIISFWPTTTPIYGTSWRYYLSSFFNTVGNKSWKGRELILRPQYNTLEKFRFEYVKKVWERDFPINKK